MARFLTNERITAADHFQDTRHIEFDLGDRGPSYDPGDILTIFPSQDSAAITKLLGLIGYDIHDRVRIELADAEPDNPGQQAMEVRLCETSRDNAMRINFGTGYSQQKQEGLQQALMESTEA